MPKTWIVLVDDAKARVIEAHTLSHFDEIARLEHPEGRMAEGELRVDDQGTAFESAGQGRHGIGEAKSVSTVEMERFAREVVQFLERARVDKKVDRLYLVSSAQILGEIRKAMPTALAQIIVDSVAKELTHIKPEEITNHLYITFGT